MMEKGMSNIRNYFKNILSELPKEDLFEFIFEEELKIAREDEDKINKYQEYLYNCPKANMEN